MSCAFCRPYHLYKRSFWLIKIQQNCFSKFRCRLRRTRTPNIDVKIPRSSTSLCTLNTKQSLPYLGTVFLQIFADVSSRQDMLNLHVHIHCIATWSTYNAHNLCVITCMCISPGERFHNEYWSGAGNEVIPWITSTCLPRNAVKNFVILHLAMRLQSATSMTCPLLTASNENICVIEGALGKALHSFFNLVRVLK